MLPAARNVTPSAGSKRSSRWIPLLSGPTTSNEKGMSPMRYLILIVDDDPDAAARVANIVEVLIKCSTERAANREEALLKLRTAKYNAVIADLNMGGVFEGELLLEAMKTYFAVPPGTIIVSVTGGETSARN